MVKNQDELVAGTVVRDRYRIDHILGRGGMGCVYGAEHIGIKRRVAIKVLNHNADEARFRREAFASGRLDHPNIVAVSDFGVLDDDRCYLVLEALEGETLADRLLRRGPLPWREAFDIIRQVLRGLRHAHERGVVHRDIKPDNIFLAMKDGVEIVKILDFGIAKLVAGTAADPCATRTGMTVGTPAYLAPEQVVGGEITPATDLYSTTIMLYELLAGSTPFDDDNPLGAMTAHLVAEPPAITGVELPDGFDELVQLGLAKSSTDRIASAREYIARLDGIRRLHDPHVRVPTSRESAPIAVPRRAESLADITEPVPRSWLLAAAMVLGSVTLLAIVLALAT